MKFSEHEFKPSDVIEGLNEFYRKVRERRRFEAMYGLSGAAGPFLTIKRRWPGLHATFYDPSAVEAAITWLREECDIFYTPGMTWDDLKHKMPYKAAGKEFGTADIREMYPCCKIIKPRSCGKKIWISSNPSFRDDPFNRMVDAERAARKYSLKQFEKELGLTPNRDLPWDLSRDEADKVMNYCTNDVICTEELMREKEWIDGQEALEGLRTLYYAVATIHERALRHLDECANDDRDWPETSYMLEYIRKRVETSDENIEYLCKENDSLRDQVANLKDLINQIHEESDI